MPKYKVVLYETTRWEYLVEADSEEDARDKAGYIELRDDPDCHEDMDYYEVEVMDVQKE